MTDPNQAAILRTRFWKMEDGCHEHRMKTLRKGKEKLVGRQSVADTAQTLDQKYGRRGHVLSRGAFGNLFAVKEIEQRQGESLKTYHKRFTAEFCLSSPMHHQNVIATLDLLQDTEGVYRQIMEYCSGGDLYIVLLAPEQLGEAEADCFYQQLLQGVEYIHEMDILLTKRGTIKITDLDNAECFRTAWGRDAHMSAGYMGKEFDPRAVDVWACEVIYMAMRTRQYMWQLARVSKYRSSSDMLKTATQQRATSQSRLECRNVIYSILDPDPTYRLTAHQALSSEWIKQIDVCIAGTEGS
ncbi:kinase-like protein [Phaeosphaeriaceae sp. SRC1lsM3a]|nr:kinase-like protein [Stagonospora sp. SRC1lsM3a]